MTQRERTFTGPLTGKTRSLGPVDTPEEEIDPVAQYTILQQLKTDVAHLQKAVKHLEMDLVTEREARKKASGSIWHKAVSMVSLVVLGFVLGFGTAKMAPVDFSIRVKRATQPVASNTVVIPAEKPGMKTPAVQSKPGTAPSTAPKPKPVVTPKPASPQKPATADITVRLVRGSTSYHAPKCWILGRKKVSSLPLSKAKSSGYTECRYCGSRVKEAAVKGGWE